ncbi:helix-turn-helix domain-containing protein [Streptomyces sp. NPDC002588]|uniref:helix-turn-helix domain-containing protein n=1 Tax=Streptomyces sp. NPDC002588 TaxID=3154419 RepID=UPI0033269B65
MDTRNPSAHPHAKSRFSGTNHPHGGLTHDNTRHTARFTVIGNHLTQHEELSLLAIGLGAHIQSLPPGARVDIKSLAARFPEGTTRIAAALRELETHGYLRRERKRNADGRIITRTVSCNHPGQQSRPAAERPPSRRPPSPPRKALPAVPQPSCPSPTLIRTATDLLATLRRHDPRLLLSATDAEHLAPGVAAWLERDLTPGAVRQALTANLPDEPLHRPAAFLAHRLTAQLPPLAPYRTPEPPPPVKHPVRNCDGCDRGFRSPTPGLCRDCRPPLAATS